MYERAALQKLALPVFLTLLAAPSIAAQSLVGAGVSLRVSGTEPVVEAFLLQSGGTWSGVLSSSDPVRVRTENGMVECPIAKAAALNGGILVTGDCGIGTYEQRIELSGSRDKFEVTTTFTLQKDASVYSVEDRYNFLPLRRSEVDERNGPLDFVWSQNIKSEEGDLIPTNSFKSPALMMQQGRFFAALLPQLNARHVEIRALDLDVTSGRFPWMAYGAIPSEPHGHSYFRRSAGTKLTPIAGKVSYSYQIALADQPPRLGYRRIVRLLWEQEGHAALLDSKDEQKNAVRADLESFAQWGREAWETYANRIYLPFQCGDRRCGTLSSDRNYQGLWTQGESDAWFNAWFETLRTAYGWYLHGRGTRDRAMMGKAESVLNLALSSPRKGGAFSTIYLLRQAQWVPSDGWAGYSDSYHTFSMSWTAYWMLRWAQDLTPDRRSEILSFVKPYGDFLLAHQQSSGVIPSWFDAESLKPREEFRNFNAETGPSALLLATLGEATGDQRYIMAAERAMAFIEKEVVPRQRWFDFETFLSCARKDYNFFDRWTAQYPQNNLAEIQTVSAMLALFHVTHKPEYLKKGTEMLDYLLLTQQVWNNPEFTPRLLGGFTTQNTDQEWSDARQCYGAIVLEDYYEATGDFEYLERAVAAARSTFAVAPWENWAHTGYIDQPGALTGFHWGTGSAMTTVEMLYPRLGDALIDLRARRGVGFNDCTISDVEIHGDSISFRVSSGLKNQPLRVRFRGVDSKAEYLVRWNGGRFHSISGATLAREGFAVGSGLG